MQYVEFEPDWSTIWTAEEAEERIADFKFAGPGWYFHGKDAILVVPFGPSENPWVQSWPKGQKFTFYAYNQHDPTASFNAVANAPTRVDDRPLTVSA